MTLLDRLSAGLLLFGAGAAAGLAGFSLRTFAPAHDRSLVIF